MNLNSEKFKKTVIGFGVTVGTLGLGFLIYSLYKKYKKNKTLDMIDKFCKENENLLSSTNPEAIHNANKNDKLDEKDEQGKPTQPEDNTSSSQLIEFAKIKLIFKETTHISIDAMMRAYKYLEENSQVFTKAEDIQLFKENVLWNLEQTLTSILKYNNVEAKDFFKSYYHYCKVDEKFKTKAQYLARFKLDFMKSEKVPCDFDQTIKDNFLKIVTNIFFLTAYRCWLDFKASHLDKENIPGDIADQIYTKHLKEVRKEVYKFFNVNKLKEINVKYLVRLYPYSLPKSDPLRVSYAKYSKDINVILDNLNKKIIPTEFLSDSGPSFKVEDKVIELDSIANETIDYKTLSS